MLRKVVIEYKTLKLNIFFYPLGVSNTMARLRIHSLTSCKYLLIVFILFTISCYKLKTREALLAIIEKRSGWAFLNVARKSYVEPKN